MKKLTFIGIGNVGFALANKLQAHGYMIVVAHNDPGNSTSVKDALSKNSNFQIMPVQQAVEEAEVIFLATPFQIIDKVLTGIKFNGKTLVDYTNPVGLDERGLKHGLDSKISGAETIQQIVPDAKVVKAFTIYGFENFIDANFPKYNVKPAMLIASNYAEAKKEIKPIINCCRL